MLAPALIAVAIVFGRPLQRVSTEVQDAIAHSTVTAEEALSGIRVVKSYVRESFEIARYGGDLAGVVGAGTRLALWRAGFGALMGFLGFGAVAVLLWYTGHQVIEGSLGVGTLTGFLLYGITIGGSLATIAGLYGQFREGTGAVTRVFELIDTRPTIVDAPGAVDIGHVDGAIEVDGVTFAYDGANPVLRDVSLSIAPGEVLALVGPSGAGKTTLVGLLPRLWDATSGAIRIDGRDVRDVTTASLRERIGLVPAGGDPVRRHRPRQHPLRPPRGEGRRRSSPRRDPPTPTTSSSRSRTATTRRWGTGARGSPGASASGWRSPGPSSRTRRSSSSTRRRARSTTSPSGWSRRRSTGSRSAGRRSSWRTACPRSGPPTASRSSTTAGSWSWAPTTSCWPSRGLYRRLYRLQFSEAVPA